MMAAPQNYLAVIKVVGIGGGGVNAVNRMIEAGLRGVESDEKQALAVESELNGIQVHKGADEQSGGHQEQK